MTHILLETIFMDVWAKIAFGCELQMYGFKALLEGLN